MSAWFAVPAKFRWNTRENPIFDDGLWDIHEVDHPNRLPICTVDRGDDHDEATRQQAEQRAKLIAAAPTMVEELERERKINAQLLHALKSLLALCEGEVPSLLEDDHHYQLVTDAIAKAEGR